MPARHQHPTAPAQHGSVAALRLRLRFRCQLQCVPLPAAHMGADLCSAGIQCIYQDARPPGRRQGPGRATAAARELELAADGLLTAFGAGIQVSGRLCGSGRNVPARADGASFRRRRWRSRRGSGMRSQGSRPFGYALAHGQPNALGKPSPVKCRGLLARSLAKAGMQQLRT